MAKSSETAHRGSPEAAFGRVLKAVRESQGVSQEQLGFASGYHRTYISLLERGLKSPSLRTIFDLASCLNIQPSELVRRIERRRSQAAKD